MCDVATCRIIFVLLKPTQSSPSDPYNIPQLRLVLSIVLHRADTEKYV